MPSGRWNVTWNSTEDTNGWYSWNAHTLKWFLETSKESDFDYLKFNIS
jgi:hypothetical protein